MRSRVAWAQPCGVARHEATADVMAETLRRSSLGRLSAGSPVNLERAARVDSRLGGHIVQGHVDGTGRVAAVAEVGRELVRAEARTQIDLVFAVFRIDGVDRFVQLYHAGHLEGVAEEIDLADGLFGKLLKIRRFR